MSVLKETILHGVHVSISADLCGKHGANLAESMKPRKKRHLQQDKL